MNADRERSGETEALEARLEAVAAQLAPLAARLAPLTAQLAPILMARVAEAEDEVAHIRALLRQRREVAS